MNIVRLVKSHKWTTTAILLGAAAQAVVVVLQRL